jgi:hypothetical protein
MATFQSEYEDTTNTIDSIVSSQLSSVLNWVNMPGGLTKVVSSAAGFAWGFNSNNSVWSCSLPCSGNWQSSDLSDYKIGTIQDIAADDTTVYLLYTSIAGNTNLLTTNANRQGSWTTIEVPLTATHIFSTHTYVWAQDAGNKKQMCPKPCTMSNWIPSDESTIEITSSTNTHLYGKDPIGNPMQTDETMRSGWYPISGFGDAKVEAVVGSENAVYAIDDKQNTLKYDGKTVQPITTSGYSPLNITTGNNQLWMTSQTPGMLGNVFSRLEEPDYTSITNTIAPLDKKRDELATNIETTFNQQTDVMTVNKQVNDVVTFFKTIFKLDGDTSKRAKAQAGHINEQIRSTQSKLDQIKTVEPVMQIGIIVLLILSANYALLGGLLGWVSHLISIVVISVGLYFILKTK